MKGFVKEYIGSRKDEMVHLLKDLVNVYSPSSDADAVSAIGDVFEGKLKELGFTVSRPGSETRGRHVIAEYQGSVKGPKVLLMGHMDTVEVENPFEWKFSQDGPYVRGLGVLDMKGGLVTMLYALKAILAQGGEIPGSIRIFLNSDEEPGSPTSRPLLPEVLEGVDAALICEPGKPDGSLTAHRKGCAIYKVRVLGRASHAGAQPEKGVSAIRELAEKIIAIENLKGNGTTINTGVFCGGTAPYIIPESAEAAIDVRVLTPEERTRVEVSLEEIGKKTYLDGTQTFIEGEFHRPPIGPIKGTRSLQKIVEQKAEALGVPVSFVTHVEGGVGDINNIVDMGVPGIDGMGPVGLGAHSRDEYIELSSLFDKAVLTALVVWAVLSGEFNSNL